MALEVVGFRLYAPYFGYSIYVWGSMISVVMLALAAGYGLGGRLADRSGTSRPLYGVILASAFYQLAVVFAARSVLRAVSTWGDFDGVVAATLLVFAPPMAALAGVGPYLVRLLARSGRVGSTAGMVYAVSTAGSMAGTLGASFYLLPHFGTQATLEILCAATALMGVAGLVGRRRWTVVVLAPFVALGAAPPVVWSSDTIWTGESAYNLIRVVRQGSRVELLLNSRNSIHTIRDEASAWTGFYYDDFALGPLLAPSRRVLVLGMGGGGSVRATRCTAPGASIDAVEIDAKVVEAADRFFGVRGDANLHIHVADARPWLARSRDRYSLVHVDLYHGGPYIPFYLSTVEFFTLVRSHTTEDGLLMMNVFDPGANGDVLASMVATIRQAYPSVMVLPAGFAGNRIVLAFAREETLASVRQRLAAMEGTDMWHVLARKSAGEIEEPAVRADATVFTDDRAPIEAMTRRMLRE
ncbi:MAG TPA: fused MFS/spermidine synthase [Bryobacteraceae bacterium]|jgi:spermidine synthase|nr:fused MFS/spermidine synthase [Bryobacteraceae bacterium]